MDKKINCAEELNKLLSSLENKSEFLYVQKECVDSWNENSGIFMIYLMEDDYRDYDALWRDINDEIRDALKPDVIVYGTKNKLPESGLVLNIHAKSSGLVCEFEFYRVENGKPIPRADD